MKSHTLICLPYAGGGTLDFRTWPSLFPDQIQVSAIRLPGRETRMRERPLTSIRDMADLIIREHGEGLFSGPWAIYGHSMGSWMGFELARAARRKGLASPTHLFAASRWAPDAKNPNPPIHHLSDAAFIDAIQDRYQAIPQQLLDQPEILAMFLPALRADFTAIDTYPYVPGSPLDCEIFALRGAKDSVVTESHLDGWREHTTGTFRQASLPGGHFFLREDREPLCDLICGALLKWRANQR